MSLTLLCITLSPTTKAISVVQVMFCCDQNLKAIHSKLKMQILTISDACWKVESFMGCQNLVLYCDGSEFMLS